MIPTALIRFGADAYVVVANALATWIKGRAKPFTNLVPQSINFSRIGRCNSCERVHDDVRAVEIGAAVYELCPGCRQRAAA